MKQHNRNLVFRDDLAKVAAIQEHDWISLNMVSGHRGFVKVDIDMVVRLYGGEFGTDETGKFMLLELKYGKNNGLTHSEKMTFRLIHSLLRKADPDASRYLGFFLINYTNRNWDFSEFWINGIPATREKFKQFLEGKMPVQKYNPE